MAEALGKLLQPDPVVEDAYDAALDRAFRGVFEERRRAEAERLERLLAERGLRAIADLPWDTDNLALYDALLARSWACRHDKPSLMVQLADLAVKHAQSLDASLYGVCAVADLQARAWAELGNAYRVRDDFGKAERSLSLAREICEQGTGDEALEIRITELEASLAADLLLYPIALLKLTRVHKYYEEKGEQHLAGRTLILKGLYTNYAGDIAGAIKLLSRGASMIDPERDPDLVYCAAHNELLCLVNAGRCQEAKRLRIRRSRELSLGKGRVHEVRLRAIDGRLDAAEWKHERAEAIFREVKQEFSELGRGYHAGIAGLDLAVVLLRRGRREEATEEALEAIKVFQQHNIPQETFRALNVLRECLLMGIVDAVMLQEIADRLRRAEHDPQTPYIPPPSVWNR